MNKWWYVVLVLVIVAVVSGFAWIVWLLTKRPNGSAGANPDQRDILAEANVSAASVFNNEFREELKNRGRLHFENIINENAMFLQQDLRLTTSQLNDFMKEEIKKVLRDEFATYEESISNAKDQAIEAIQQTQTVIEEQRTLLKEQLETQVAEEKAQAIARFDAKMGEIVNHYIIEAIGGEIDLSDQLEYIFNHLEENKQAILEDIKHGA